MIPSCGRIRDENSEIFECSFRDLGSVPRLYSVEHLISSMIALDMGES
jgi:hypothetical protein